MSISGVNLEIRVKVFRLYAALCLYDLTGIVFVGISKGILLNGNTAGWMVFTSIICALGAALFGASQVATTLYLGWRNSQAENQYRTRHNVPIRSETMNAATLTAFGQITGVPILALLALWHPSTLGTAGTISAIAAGALLCAPYVFLSRLGNMHRTNPSSNLWLTVSPCAAVVWLWLFRGLDLAHPTWFFVGAALIISSGMLIHSRSASKPAYVSSELDAYKQNDFRAHSAAMSSNAAQ